MASATNEKRIRQDEDRLKRDRITNETVIKSLMSHREGRRWIWLQLSKCGVYLASFDPSAGGHSRMCFSEGKRSLGLELLADITRYCPESYILMTKENSGVKIEDEQNDDES